LKVKFWGVRGSIPTPWKEAIDVGGNTSCVQVIPDQDSLLVLDAGTGIRILGNDLIKRKKHTNRVGHVLLSHTHWDHIQGFPFFGPAFIQGNCFYIYGAQKTDERLEDILIGQMRYKYFPVELEQMGAEIKFVELQEETITINKNIKVTTRLFNHPGGVYGFRIEHEGQVLVYVTDIEYTIDTVDEKLIDFAKGADLLIHDAQYTTEEYKYKEGWGHSSPDVAAFVAKKAKVKRLMLFHHEPNHSDKTLYEIEEKTRQKFTECYLAKEGQEIDLASL